MASEDEGYIRDEMPDGTDFDGKGLLDLVRAGKSPFKDAWDVNLFVEEIETVVDTKVADIPLVSKGSNNYVSASLAGTVNPH